MIAGHYEPAAQARPVYLQHRTYLVTASTADECRFCCRSLLMVAANSDSVLLMEESEPAYRRGHSRPERIEKRSHLTNGQMRLAMKIEIRTQPNVCSIAFLTAGRVATRSSHFATFG
jgi:hypothetical protein